MKKFQKSHKTLVTSAERKLSVFFQVHKASVLRSESRFVNFKKSLKSFKSFRNIHQYSKYKINEEFSIPANFVKNYKKSRNLKASFKMKKFVLILNRLSCLFDPFPSKKFNNYILQEHPRLTIWVIYLKRHIHHI